jgi:hypothetical protein
MAFNASVVFVHGAARWVALAACLFLLALFAHRLARGDRTSP